MHIKLKTTFEKLSILPMTANQDYLIDNILDLEVTTLIAGVDRQKKRCIILPLKHPISMRTESAFPKWNGITIIQEKHVSTLTKGREWFLIFKENSVDLDISQEIFIHIFEDICIAVKEEKTYSRIFDKIIIVLSKWEKFFKKIKSNALSKNVLQGLFGELLFLQKILIQKGEETQIDVLSGWYGIDYSKRDFKYHKNFIEVKTSLKKKPYSIDISNTSQLEKPEDYRMFLYCYILEVDKQLGKSVKELIEEIQNILLEFPKELFKEKLMQIGIIPEVLTEDLLEKFSIQENLLYEVDEKFPSIDSTIFPNAIFNVKYSISLEQCNEFKLNIEELLDEIEVK